MWAAGSERGGFGRAMKAVSATVCATVVRQRPRQHAGRRGHRLLGGPHERDAVVAFAWQESRVHGSHLLPRVREGQGGMRERVEGVESMADRRLTGLAGASWLRRGWAPWRAGASSST